MATELWAIGLVISATFVGAFGPILLKKASSKKLSKISSLIRNYHLMGGVSLYGLGTLLFIPALKGGDLSILYPFVSLTYIWVSLLSVKFLGEKMSMMKWWGIGLIILGVSFIGVGS
ncbi:multidrug transporter [Candidatus Woesearchaeota archaeon]|nr:multidrug transporter [Candidatus Woesearchaeota archaeon]|tara:strand:+ start:15740 stop:16090 length:351 start_codon:yes stop_codon:yes gene_type:complete